MMRTRTFSLLFAFALLTALMLLAASALFVPAAFAVEDAGESTPAAHGIAPVEAVESDDADADADVDVNVDDEAEGDEAEGDEAEDGDETDIHNEDAEDAEDAEDVEDAEDAEDAEESEDAEEFDESDADDLDEPVDGDEEDVEDDACEEDFDDDGASVDDEDDAEDFDVDDDEEADTEADEGVEADDNACEEASAALKQESPKILASTVQKPTIAAKTYEQAQSDQVKQAAKASQTTRTDQTAKPAQPADFVQASQDKRAEQAKKTAAVEQPVQTARGKQKTAKPQQTVVEPEQPAKSQQATAKSEQSSERSQRAASKSQQAAQPEQPAPEPAAEPQPTSADGQPASVSAQGSPGPLAEGAYVIKAKRTYGAALSTAFGQSAGQLKVDDLDGLYDQVFYLQPDASGLYAIFSLASGLALDASESSLKQKAYTGSNGQLFELRKNGSGYSIVSKSGRAVAATADAAVTASYTKGASDQRFAFTAAPLVIPGMQVLYTATGTSAALGVPDSSTVEGTAATSDYYSAGDGQKMLVQIADEGYDVKPLASGQSFAPSGSQVVQQAKPHTWQVSFSKSGSRRGIVFTDAATGKSIQVSGKKVSLAPYKATAAQAFTVVPTTPAKVGCFAFSNTASSNVLDVANGSWRNGAALQLWTANGSGAQAFLVKLGGDGFYRIENAMTGYTLTATGDGISQASYKGAENQLWIPVAGSAGGIAWVNASSGKALAAASLAAGAKASTAAPSSDGSSMAAALQSWALVDAAYGLDPVLQDAMWYVLNGSSQTGYQIMVDRNECRTVVAEYSGGEWRPLFNWTCSPGAPSTPTVGGEYTITGRGYSFSGALGGDPYTCYYYTQFWGDYLFHSIPYWQGTWVEQDNRLGQRLSHGCVRLATENAKWLYDNIPDGTRVYIYD